MDFEFYEFKFFVKIIALYGKRAPVAQWLEHWSYEPRVAGSNRSDAFVDVNISL